MVELTARFLPLDVDMVLDEMLPYNPKYNSK